MDEGIIEVLYSIRKNQVIQFFRLNPENSYHISYAYAIANDCYPLFYDYDDPAVFADCYRINKGFIDELTKYIDEECFMKRKYKSFYELEEVFGRNKRTEMIIALRYSYLAGFFKEKAFWNSLTENGKCPVEALSLAKVFELDEI